LSSSPFISKIDKTLFTVDDSLHSWIVAIRRHIHQYPELSFEEIKTAEFVQEKLGEHKISSKNGIAKTGVVAELGEECGQDLCVALRADMDALPVLEETNLSFASRHNGIMHACGHDGHVAMLLGAGALLSRLPVLPGRVKLLFQPAEEHGNGASVFVKEGVIDDVDAVFGGHIDTHFQTGQITVDEGLICAFADPFHIKITGKSGHAARPHEARDAIVAASSLVMLIQTLVSREVDPNRAEVITIGCFQAGCIHNIIAGEALLKGTLRSTDEATRGKTMDGLRRMVRSIESLHDVQATLVFEEGLPAVINSKRAAGIARAAAWETTAIHNVISQGFPSLGGEDFAFYQQVTDGCMVRFGGKRGGTVGPAHSNTFDFDENCLSLGSRWLATVAYHWLLNREPEVDVRMD